MQENHGSDSDLFYSNWMEHWTLLENPPLLVEVQHHPDALSSLVDLLDVVLTGDFPHLPEHVLHLSGFPLRQSLLPGRRCSSHQLNVKPATGVINMLHKDKSDHLKTERIFNLNHKTRKIKKISCFIRTQEFQSYFIRRSNTHLSPLTCTSPWQPHPPPQTRLHSPPVLPASCSHRS